MDTAEVIRTILLVDIISMGLLGLFYLSQRRLSRRAFYVWGLLAALVPVLGPFLVIASRPGSWDPDFSFSKKMRQAGNLFYRQLPQQVLRYLSLLLPVEPGSKKLTRIERVRQRRMVRRGGPGTRK